jgi:uncharacterized membrane protein HdeD (DUF308 family)
MKNLKTSISDAIKNWYVPLVVGIIFIIFGIYIFTVPLAAYATLAILFSLAFYFSGIGDIFFAISNQKSLDGWGWYLVSGILTFLLGIYLMIYPAIALEILPFVVGFALLFRSFHGLGFALDLKELGVGWGTLAFVSVLGILLSFILLAKPIAAAISLVAITAFAIIVAGIFGILLSFQLKKLKDLPAKL